MTNLQCECLELNLLTSGEYYGHFIFTHLEGNDASTFANMVRRALLSSIIESKIVGVRFGGVSDEFSSMDGVREDLLEIILNLKEIIIKNPSYEPCYGRIKVFGPAIVTASSLILPPNVTVVNPRSHILTICEESLVEFEIRIEPGKTYAFPENRKAEGYGNFLNVDANFIPVLKVNSYIHTLDKDMKPISQSIKNDKEELHMEIYTNGAILPHQALILAGNKLGSMVLALLNIKFPEILDFRLDIDEKKSQTKKDLWLKGKKREFLKKSVKRPTLIKKNSEGTNTKIKNPFEQQKNITQTINIKSEKPKIKTKIQVDGKTYLEDLGLSKRIIKILKNSKILNIKDLITITTNKPDQLEKIKGLGVISIEEIYKKLDLISVE